MNKYMYESMSILCARIHRMEERKKGEKRKRTVKERGGREGEKASLFFYTIQKITIMNKAMCNCDL